MSYNNDDNRIRRRKVSSNTPRTSTVDDTRSVNNKKGNIKSNNKQINRSVKKTSPRSKKGRKRKKKKSFKLLKKLMVAMLVVLFLASSAFSIFVFSIIKDSKPVTQEALRSKYISSQVVGNESIPKYLKDAVVSIEDERFYKHHGVDTLSLLRSIVHNIFTKTTQGGSTIEMQISKNLLTSDDKTIKRKIKDMYNATSMDKNISKDEILDIYLNNIYLGKSAYGVGKGAKVYFGKNVKGLNLAQCAMLAGITNNPAKYSEFNAAKRRQETILYKMHELGYINDTEYQDALSENITFISEIG